MFKVAAEVKDVPSGSGRARVIGCPRPHRLPVSTKKKRISTIASSLMPTNIESNMTFDMHT